MEYWARRKWQILASLHLQLAAGCVADVIKLFQEVVTRFFAPTGPSTLLSSYLAWFRLCIGGISNRAGLFLCVTQKGRTRSLGQTVLFPCIWCHHDLPSWRHKSHISLPTITAATWLVKRLCWYLWWDQRRCQDVPCRENPADSGKEGWVPAPFLGIIWMMLGLMESFPWIHPRETLRLRWFRCPPERLLLHPKIHLK